MMTYGILNMDNDIVTRLRAYNIGNIGHEASSHMEETLYEAADEIEYLRSEIGNVNSEYNKLWRKYEQALKDNSTLIHVCQDPGRGWVRGE